MRPLGLLTVFCVLNFGICQARHDDQAKRNRSLSAEVSKLIILSDQYGEKKNAQQGHCRLLGRGNAATAASRAPADSQLG